MEAAVIGLGILMIVAAVYLAYRSGEHAQATIDAVAQFDRVRDSSITHYTAITLQRDSLAKANDEKAQVIHTLHEQNAVLADAAAAKKSAAKAVRDRLSFHGDSAIIKTDTGTVVYVIPIALTQQIATERLANVSALAAMERSRDSTRAEADSLLKEVDGLHAEIQVDSAAKLQLLANVAAANKEIDALKKATRPGITLKGVLVGVVGTLAAVAAAVIR